MIILGFSMSFRFPVTAVEGLRVVSLPLAIHSKSPAKPRFRTYCYISSPRHLNVRVYILNFRAPGPVGGQSPK